MLTSLAIFSGGALLLLLGGDALVRGASGLSLRFGVRPLLVGVVVVGFGTSAPELVVNLTAAWQGHTGLALGNVVGSNIANVGLILGLAALLVPIAVSQRLLALEGPALVAASLVAWLLAADGNVGRLDGVLLLIGFMAVAVMVLRGSRAESEGVRAEFGASSTTAQGLARNLVRTIIGLALLVYGAHLVVGSAVQLARGFGLSEVTIGLTVVAIGTSLPELVATLVAAFRRQHELAVGNVIGSCLFNLLLVLGSTAVLAPLPASQQLVAVDLPAMLAFVLVLLPLTRRDLVLERRDGAFLLAGFVAWFVWQLYFAYS